VRKNALVATLRLGKDAAGAPALVEGGAVKLLVARCTAESAELLPHVLAALETCMMMSAAGLKEGIALNAIKVIAKLLSLSPALDATEHACYCLATLTVGDAEKKAAMAEGVIKELIMYIGRMLHYAEDGGDGMVEKVATAAAATLMSLTIDNEAKAEAVRAGAVKALAPLLQNAIETELSNGLGHANSTLYANVLKCMANLAEHPLGRKQLREAALGDLIALQETADELMNKNTMIATAKITWNP